MRISQDETTARRSEGVMNAIPTRSTTHLAGLAFAALAALTVTPSAVRADPRIYQETLAHTAVIVQDGFLPDVRGTGVLIDADNRLLATAAHVTEGLEKVLVFFADHE